MRAGLLTLVVVFTLGCGGEPFAEVAPLDPEIAALIHDLVDGTDGAKREAAHDALIARGAVVVEPLAAELDRADVDAGVGAWIAEVLGNLGEAAAPAAPALARRLMQGGDCSATTSWALGQIGALGVPFLAKALSSEHAQARIWAVDALSNLEAVAAPASDALLRALDDPEVEVRRSAASTLSNLPEAAERAVPALLRMTRDPDDEVRANAGEALAALPHADAAILERLREMVLGDPEAYTRGVVLDALGPQLLDDADAVAFLRRVAALPGEEHGLGPKADLLLLARGIDEPEVVKRVASFEEAEAFDVLLERAETLSKGGPNARRAALPLLQRVLGWSPEEKERVAAAQRLGALGEVAGSDEPTRRLLATHGNEANDVPAVNAACKAALAALGRPR